MGRFMKSLRTIVEEEKVDNRMSSTNHNEEVGKRGASGLLAVTSSHLYCQPNQDNNIKHTQLLSFPANAP